MSAITREGQVSKLGPIIPLPTLTGTWTRKMRRAQLFLWNKGIWRELSPFERRPVLETLLRNVSDVPSIGLWIQKLRARNDRRGGGGARTTRNVWRKGKISLCRQKKLQDNIFFFAIDHPDILKSFPEQRRRNWATLRTISNHVEFRKTHFSYFLLNFTWILFEHS